MKKPASLARRISRVSAERMAAQPIEITEIVEGAKCTAAYIAKKRVDLGKRHPRYSQCLFESAVVRPCRLEHDPLGEARKR